MREIEIFSCGVRDRVALVDDSDYELLNQFTWYAHYNNGYIYARSGRTPRGRFIMHRLILDAPRNMLVDHIDHNGLNNQRHNLRLATKSQNGMNRKPNANSTSRFKGVCWHKRVGKWYAQSKLNGDVIHIGYFDSEIEAAIAYNVFIRQFHGEFAVLNEI